MLSSRQSYKYHRFLYFRDYTFTTYLKKIEIIKYEFLIFYIKYWFSKFAHSQIYTFFLNNKWLFRKPLVSNRGLHPLHLLSTITQYLLSLFTDFWVNRRNSIFNFLEQTECLGNLQNFFQRLVEVYDNTDFQRKIYLCIDIHMSKSFL